jgi:hypothetical protein
VLNQRKPMAHSAIVGRPIASDSLTYLLRGVSTPLFLWYNIFNVYLIAAM